MDLADTVREVSKGGANTLVTLIRRFRVYRRDTSSLGMTGTDLKIESQLDVAVRAARIQ